MKAKMFMNGKEKNVYEEKIAQMIIKEKLFRKAESSIFLNKFFSKSVEKNVCMHYLEHLLLMIVHYNQVHSLNVALRQPKFHKNTAKIVDLRMIPLWNHF